MARKQSPWKRRYQALKDAGACPMCARRPDGTKVSLRQPKAEKPQVVEEPQVVGETNPLAGRVGEAPTLADAAEQQQVKPNKTVARAKRAGLKVHEEEAATAK